MGRFVFSFLFVAFSVLFPAQGSDHIDGAATILDGQADLTDLYAFPTPNKKGSLTVILNAYPGVAKDGHFSSKVSYDIFIRLAEPMNPLKRLGFKTYVMDALKVNCSFEDPSHHGQGGLPQGKAKCTLIKDTILGVAPLAEVSGAVGSVLENDTMKVFTGARTDAFFISSSVFIKATGRKEFVSQEPKSGNNGMHTINVMSIALELNLEKIDMSQQMLALAAQSYTTRGGVYEPLDRVGRPEITNLSLHDYSEKNPIKRGYNHIIPFSYVDVEGRDAKFKKRLVDNISAYDKLDGKADWADSEKLSTFADLLLDDFLLIDMSGVCVEGKNEFFAIEWALMLEKPTTSCGGRHLKDDIMATLYSLYIGGLNADPKDYETGVTVPYQGNPSKALASEFPYLAESGNTGLKESLLFKAAKALQE